MIPFLRLFENPELVQAMDDMGVPLIRTSYPSDNSFSFGFWKGEIFVMRNIAHGKMVMAMHSLGYIPIDVFPEEEVQDLSPGASQWYHEVIQPCGRMWLYPKGADTRQVISFWSDPKEEHIKALAAGKINLITKKDDQTDPYECSPKQMKLSLDQTYIEWPFDNLQPINNWVAPEVSQEQRDAIADKAQQHIAAAMGVKRDWKTNGGATLAAKRARKGGFDSTAQMRFSQPAV